MLSKETVTEEMKKITDFPRCINYNVPILDHDQDTQAPPRSIAGKYHPIGLKIEQATDKSLKRSSLFSKLVIFQFLRIAN